MTTETLQAPAPRTPLQEFWHYFKGNKGAVSGLVFIIIICLMALFADVVAPHSPSDQTDKRERQQGDSDKRRND
jgi:dipeptide transport system permease protein